jgi:hypothetical protein
MTIELYMSNIYSINQKEYMSSILLNRGQTDIMAETTKNEKDYQGVTVEKNWSLLAFAKENGNPKYAECVNSQTGEVFNALAFEDNDGNIKFCHFGYSTEGYTEEDILRDRDKLNVGLNSNGKYTLYKQEGGWKTINLFD